MLEARVAGIARPPGQRSTQEGPSMLSDADQRRLSEIETGLRRDDPAFVRRFTEAGRPAARGGATGRTWVLIGVLVLCFAWLWQSALMVVIGLSAVSAGVCLWAVPVEVVDGLVRRDDETG
jgi:Protein of unknown function (DUF3040)